MLMRVVCVRADACNTHTCPRALVCVFRVMGCGTRRARARARASASRRNPSPRPHRLFDRFRGLGIPGLFDSLGLPSVPWSFGLFRLQIASTAIKAGVPLGRFSRPVWASLVAGRGLLRRLLRHRSDSLVWAARLRRCVKAARVRTVCRKCAKNAAEDLHRVPKNAPCAEKLG